METNFYVLATACLLLANKSLRTRVGSSRPRRREELLRSAYGVQFRGRAVERGTAEAIKWEGKLAAAELEVLTALGFDVHITDPLEVLDQQRAQKVWQLCKGIFVLGSDSHMLLFDFDVHANVNVLRPYPISSHAVPDHVPYIPYYTIASYTVPSSYFRMNLRSYYSSSAPHATLKRALSWWNR